MIRYIPFIAAAGGGGGGSFIIYEYEDQNPSGVVTSGPAAKKAEFLARLTVSGEEGFEGNLYFEGDPFPAENGLSMSSIQSLINGVQLTYSDPDSSGQVVLSSATGSGRFNTSSVVNESLYLLLGNSDNVIGNFAFDTPVAAFGAYMTDVGDFVGQVSMRLNKTGGGSDVYDITHTVNGASGGLLFWGFVDSTGVTYDSIDVMCDSAAEAIGIDDIVIATPAQLA